MKLPFPGMFGPALLKSLVLGWVKQFALSELLKMAADNRPDFKTEFPKIFGGGWMLVWILEVKDPPPSPDASKLFRPTLKGHKFQVWWAKSETG